VNVASFYGDIYDSYATIADANKLHDKALEYRIRSDELKNISYRFGNAIDPFNMIYKARTITDANQKKKYMDEGIKELNLRLKTNPNDFPVLATMADVMLDDLHDTLQFEYYIKAALKVQPDHAKAQFKLGSYYFQTNKNLEEAKTLVSNSLKGWSDNSLAYTELGYYYAVHNKIDSANKFWLKAVELNPADCTAVNNLRIIKRINK
jgi:tetratricopeptide (TPR) repeat protein